MQEQYADICVDISHEKLDRTFQYRVPEHLRGILEPGMCVQIPFGNGNRLIKGYVLELSERCKFPPEKMKEIAGIAQKETDVTDQMIQLAAWMKKNYGSTMIQALKTVLPAKQSVKKLEKRYVELLMDQESLTALYGECLRKKQAAKARILQAFFMQEKGQRIPYQWIIGKLNVTGAAIQSLVTAGAIRIETTEQFRNPVKAGMEAQEKGGKTVEIEKNILNKEQRTIVSEVLADFDQGIHKTYLIHGVTGSGKTEVYMELIEAMLVRGRQCIVLIPEIALTYQTLLRFYNRFGDRVSVMNSTLSPGEKFDQCERAKKGEIDVIIGPRSALFTPFPNIGLIVIDEEHETSYKSESSPRYHARETAIQLARMHGGSVVLGSATPSLESYYRAKKGEYALFQMQNRVVNARLPRVYTIDLREELKAGNRSIFSLKLQELLEDRLKKGQQSILFLNRRGYAGFVSCRACGLVMKCPHCDVSLSEHNDGRLVCHYCGYSTPKPRHCPKCGSRYVLGFKAGTQQIEEKLKERYPGIRTLRMDGDTTRTRDSYEKILSAFADGKADVLIGTQMIVKGHDFPNVTLACVLAADLSLSSADYRSGERTFQLLTQAVGRAGRGNIPGEAVIQTYQPQHYAVTYAAKQDYEGFYEEEILYRELGGYPPAAHMLAVQILAGREETGWQLARELVKEMPAEDGVQILGPAPASVSKISDIYRFVIYAKSEKYEKLVSLKDGLEQFVENRQLKNEQVQFDFDPMNTI